MRFEWDENKNIKNRQKHGISFNEAKEIFDRPVLTYIDHRQDYGEVREISIGAIEGLIIIVVVHTDRDDKIRIFSARKATSKERKKFYAYFKKKIG